MNELTPTKILKGIRISIPKKYLDANNLQIGDYLGYQIQGKKLVVIPIKFVETN